MKELESLLLRIVDPVGNIQSGTFAGSTNLRRELGKKMGELDRKRREDLIGPKKKRRTKKVSTARAKRRSEKKSASAGRKKASKYLVGEFASPKRLQGTANGKTYVAVLQRSGMIKHGDKTFYSPSGAGVAALGRAVNGWTFWRYRDKGEWHTLDTLRERKRHA